MSMQRHKIFKIVEKEAGERLDRVLVGRLADFTRQYIQKLIDEGAVKVNGKKAKPGLKVKERDVIYILIPSPKPLLLEPNRVELDIIHEDKDLIVINKPAGMVVHPGHGESHIKDSLVNALLAHCGDSLSGIGGVLRPGIVHRLDKDTSGLIVVAKNDKTHQYLAGLFKDRKINKTYYALVAGNIVPAEGTIDSPIGRSGRDRKKMAVTNEEKGRKAITKYKVISSFHDCTLVEVALLTGRTHQIRVHFSAIGHPLIGDTVYGKPFLNKKFELEYGLKRLFLHAGALEFVPPAKKKPVIFNAPLPSVLARIIKLLKQKERD
jgi:23S rRNA pseudouridine1911/1915/1917 synthase